MLIMNQSIPPGLSANELEIYWDQEQNELCGLFAGRKYQFENLPSKVIADLAFIMEEDHEAMSIIESYGPKPFMDRLHLYCKCRFGGFSWEPDLSAHGVVKSECWECNCGGNCILKPLMRGALKVENGSLTQREIDVIKHLTTSTYKIGDAVAHDMGIKPSTLNKHKKSIYEKVGVNSIQALAVWASKMNLS